MTASHDLAADLELAVRAARAAGEAVMPWFRADAEVRFKGPEQPVTDADLAADRVLHEVLLGGRPGYGWLSEETADSPERLGAERLWVVDPIDGTNSFVKGIAEFAVSIGLVVGGRAVLGVVLNPATGELYHATAGGGAFRDGRPIRVSSVSEDDSARTLLSSRSEIRRGDFDAFGEPWRVAPMGSTAYRMVKIADGTGDASVSGGPKHEWDVAGAAVVLSEAGGRVTHLDGSEIRYNQAHPSWRGLAVSNGLLHQDLLATAARR